jgi:hypothetical protein
VSEDRADAAAADEDCRGRDDIFFSTGILQNTGMLGMAAIMLGQTRTIYI